MDIRNIVNDLLKGKDIGNLANQYLAETDKLNIIHTPQVKIGRASCRERV